MEINGYKKFVGDFGHDKYLGFVLAHSIDNDQAVLEIIYYNLLTGEIGDPDEITFCEAES